MSGHGCGYGRHWTASWRTRIPRLQVRGKLCVEPTSALVASRVIVMRATREIRVIRALRAIGVTGVVCLLDLGLAWVHNFARCDAKAWLSSAFSPPPTLFSLCPLGRSPPLAVGSRLSVRHHARHRVSAQQRLMARKVIAGRHVEARCRCEGAQIRHSTDSRGVALSSHCGSSNAECIVGMNVPAPS